MFVPVYKPRLETKRIILHDSHTSPEVTSVGDVKRWHVDAHEGALQMGLMGIGYHYIIERDGTVVPCRGVGLIGSHTPGHNLDSIGICLVGGRDEIGAPQDNFLAKQRVTLFVLITHLKADFGDHLQVKARYEIQRYRNKKTPRSPYLDIDQLRQDLLIFERMGVILDRASSTIHRHPSAS